MDQRGRRHGRKPAGRFRGCDTSAGSGYAKSGLAPHPRQTTLRCSEDYHPGEGWRDERRVVSQACLYGSRELLNSASAESFLTLEDQVQRPTPAAPYRVRMVESGASSKILLLSDRHRAAGLVGGTVYASTLRPGQ